MITPISTDLPFYDTLRFRRSGEQGSNARDRTDESLLWGLRPYVFSNVNESYETYAASSEAFQLVWGMRTTFGLPRR